MYTQSSVKPFGTIKLSLAQISASSARRFGAIELFALWAWMTARSQSARAWIVRSIALSAALLTVLTTLGVTAAQAAPVTLKVVSARNEPALPKTTPPTTCVPSGTQICKGTTVIGAYKYLINIDNTGTTTQRSPAPGGGCNTGDAGYPDSCLWTSIAGAKGSSPIFTQGTQADFGSMDIPNGRYLISVLADGYKLDGRHFTVSGTSVTWEGKKLTDLASEVLVELQPTPLPDAQIQAAVFEDISPVNSAPDLPAEHGLAGFQGHITDYLGEVTTNVYGDPLCSKYDASGNVIVGSGGRCLSACYVVSGGLDVGTVAPLDAAGRCPVDPTLADGTARPMLEGGFAPAGAAIEGKVKIPNLGPNRYALSVTPPDNTAWIQTTTLEGNHDWDAWVMEGATGLDTEFLIAGEPFPAIIFGYIPGPMNALSTGGTATIKGVVDAVKIYVPTTGGVGGLPGEIWGGLQGARIDKPIEYPWVTLTNLGNGDTIVWAGQGLADGTFSIPNVPVGTYTLTWWDEPQNTILDLVNVTVSAGDSVIDMGVLPLTGWWTFFDGYVFDDQNRNGIKDPGEPGLPGYTLTMRKRENSLMDRGTTTATTDPTGYYKFEAAYPMTQWLVMEAYDDGHYTTGITYQADNQPEPTTIIGAGVDVSVHPIIGLSGRMDWGKHTYDALGTNGIDPRNGGIVGTVSYDTTRNETDPAYAAVEDWQPSIPNLTVNLYSTVPCGTAALCDATRRFQLDADGAYTKGPLLNTYLTETWVRPTDCVARGVDGVPLVPGVNEDVLARTPGGGCIEAPLLGVQFGAYETDQYLADGVTRNPAANFGASVDGNYGFGDGCFTGDTVLNPRGARPGVFVPSTDPNVEGTCSTGTLQPLPAGNYLVKVVIPGDAKGRPMYKVTREEDINIGNGDVFAPAVAPSSCAGPLHIVDVAGLGTDGYGQIVGNGLNGAPVGVTVPASTPTDNPTWKDIGGSPYEGQPKPLCDTKLVNLANGKSIAPAFNLFTDVPVPGRFWFIAIDDLNFSSDPKSTTFGEKAGMPFIPVGIYDYTDRLIKTIETDYSGLADVLLPSTNRINCPTPSGVCANLYRFVGNDPGVPGRLNLNYNPSYRTIAAEFEALPGLIVPSDLAPTQVGVAVQLPGAQTTSPVMCRLDDATPQLYRVSKPYVTGANRQFTITGKGFGTSGQVTLDGTAVTAVFAAPDATGVSTINVTVPTSVSTGPKQLAVTAANGQSTVNGLTIHVLGNGYNPQLYEVGPRLTGQRTFNPVESLPLVADHAIQRALDAASSGALVVVYPNDPTYDNPRQNPRGAYYENLIISKPVKLQGVGPGSPDGAVQGSIIDGSAFAGDSPVSADWQTTIGALTWDGNQTVYDGAVISIYTTNARFTSNAIGLPRIDGFDLRGGDQQGFPGNINAIGGGATGLPAGLITQGGAIFANAYATNLQITNNVVQNNGGAYGTIRIGTPDLPAPDTDSHNRGVRIRNNRVISNAGTNQAGGIGLFAGADGYEISRNDICGNFSSEYGGGISVIGLQGTTAAVTNSIHDNRIYFNRSFDEGGGIMIAGALPANTASLSPGAGPVDIYNNLIQANLSNDDGGGIRFLMAATDCDATTTGLQTCPINVYNNFIVNNISTHEGGGISINDTPNVRIYNNTIMKNLTTATAITSNGDPAPAGLSTSVNSALLQEQLPGGVAACDAAPNSPLCFSDPLLFNNIFWDNRAGTRTASSVTGLTAPIANWDMGVSDNLAAQLSPTNTVLQTTTGTVASPTNVGTDPAVVATYDVGVTFNTWRNNPAFLGAIMISADLPPNLMGNYHISDSSPAYNAGAASKSGVAAPGFDIDNEGRPAFGAHDIGADEVPAATANLGIAIADGVTSVNPGQAVTYTISVTNAGPSAVVGAPVRSTFPASLTGVTWTCVPAASCSASGGTGNIAAPTTVSLANGGEATFTVNATVAASAAGSVVVTATVAAPGGTTDPVLANNSATDTNLVVLPLPALGVLDNFNRAGANTLGSNWSQLTIGGAAIRVADATPGNTATGLANANLPGNAYWNVPSAGAGFGAKQGAAFTIANTTASGDSLILKASGSTLLGVRQNFIRVRTTATQVIVETTTNYGVTATQRGAFAATFGSGDTLTAVANTDGSVDVWQNSTYLGRSTAVGTFTGSGRIGMQLPIGARVDNFAGGTL